MKATLKLLRRPKKWVSEQALATLFFRYDLKMKIIPIGNRTDLIVEVEGSLNNIEDLVGTTLFERVEEPEKLASLSGILFSVDKKVIK